MVTVSKIDAALRQLDTAIELYLHDFDLLSVHTLAWAAFSILISYDEATNAGGVWAKYIRENPCNETRKLANFLKHANRDPQAQLEELNDEYTHMLLLEGCKLHYQLTRTRSRPTDIFYAYDIFLDGAAQDRELERKERSTEEPTIEEIEIERHLHFVFKRQLLEFARLQLTAATTTWSDCPPRDYSGSEEATKQSLDAALEVTKARATKWHNRQ